MNKIMGLTCMCVFALVQTISIRAEDLQREVIRGKKDTIAGQSNNYHKYLEDEQDEAHNKATSQKSASKIDRKKHLRRKRDFRLGRQAFRKRAEADKIPGVKKGSWVGNFASNRHEQLNNETKTLGELGLIL